MATAASLKFSIESKWDGSGVRKAREDLRDLQQQLRDIGNKVTARVKVEPSMVGFMSKVREGVRGESVAVRVDPNLTGLQSRLNAAARGKNYNLKAAIDPEFDIESMRGLQRQLDARRLNIKVDVDYDRNSLSSLGGALNRVGSSASGASSSVGVLSKALSRLASVAKGSAIAVGTVLVSASYFAEEAVAFLGSAALGAVAGITALGTTVASAAGVIKIGMEGIKKAAENAKPAYDRLQAAVEGVFAEKMAAGFTKLNGLLDHITPEVTGIADALSNMFNGLVDTLTANEPKIKNILNDVSAMINEMVPGMKDLVQGIIDFVEKVDFKKIGQDISGWLSQAGEWISNLSIEDIRQGWEDFKSTVSGIITIVQGIGTAFQFVAEAAQWAVLPLKAFDTFTGGNAVNALNTLQTAWVNLELAALKSARSILNVMAAVADALGQDRMADRMRGWVTELDKAIPKLEETRASLSRMKEAAAATQAVDDAMRSLADGTVVTRQEVAGLQQAWDAESRAMAAAGASMTQITDRRAQLVASFEETARAAGMAESDIAKFSAKLLQIPPDIKAKVSVTADTSAALFSMQDVYTFMQQLDAAQVTPEVRAEVQNALADFRLTQDELNKIAAMNPSPEVTAIIDAAIKNLATVKGELDTTGAMKPTPTVGINNQASGPLSTIQSQIDGLHDKTITITTRHVYETLGQSGAAYNTSDMGASTAYRWRGGIAGRWKGGIAPKLPGHAGGYKLPTSGPGTHMRDGFLGITSRGMPIARVDAGEWIVNRWSSKTFHSAIDALNRKDPMAAIAALQRHVRPGGGDRRASSPTGAAPQLNGGSLDVNIHLTVDGNASRETLDAAAAAFSPKFEMALKQGVGVRAKVKG